jgi:hypothetical protein
VGRRWRRRADGASSGCNVPRTWRMRWTGSGSRYTESNLSYTEMMLNLPTDPDILCTCRASVQIKSYHLKISMDSTNNLSSDTHKNSHQCTLSSICKTGNKYEHKHTPLPCVGATGQSRWQYQARVGSFLPRSLGSARVVGSHSYGGAQRATSLSYLVSIQ